MGKIKSENGEMNDSPRDDPISRKLRIVHNEEKSKISHETEDVKE